jgi:parallel beta-helix repeat protein
MTLKGVLPGAIALAIVGVLMLTSASVQPGVSSASTATITPSPHILIMGDENFTSANGVVSGNGTQSNPYVIEDLSIEFGSGDGISIRKTSAYFVIRNVEIRNSSNGIIMYNVTNGRVEYSVLKNNSFGVQLRGCIDCVIVNNTFVDNYYGIFLWKCDVEESSNVFTNNHINVYREVQQDYWADVRAASTVAIILFSFLAIVIILLVYFRRKSMRERFD